MYLKPLEKRCNPTMISPLEKQIVKIGGKLIQFQGSQKVIFEYKGYYFIYEILPTKKELELFEKMEKVDVSKYKSVAKNTTFPNGISYEIIEGKFSYLILRPPVHNLENEVLNQLIEVVGKIIEPALPF